MRVHWNEEVLRILELHFWGRSDLVSEAKPRFQPMQREYALNPIQKKRMRALRSLAIFSNYTHLKEIRRQWSFRRWTQQRKWDWFGWHFASSQFRFESPSRGWSRDWSQDQRLRKPNLREYSGQMWSQFYLSQLLEFCQSGMIEIEGGENARKGNIPIIWTYVGNFLTLGEPWQMISMLKIDKMTLDASLRLDKLFRKILRPQILQRIRSWI